MKKVLILSDSHGNIENMEYAVEKILPDMIIHLGDCKDDAMILQDEYDDIPFEVVPGNCDYEDGPQEKIIDIEGNKILICHGHTYGVKFDYYRLQMGAMEKEVDLALFGHTHKVFYDYHNGVRLVNPGSIGLPLWGVAPSYGVMTIDGCGKIDIEIEYIE